MKRANTMSTITVELTIKVKTKFTSSNAENNPMDSSHHRCQIFTLRDLAVLCEDTTTKGLSGQHSPR